MCCWLQPAAKNEKQKRTAEDNKIPQRGCGTRYAGLTESGAWPLGARFNFPRELGEFLRGGTQCRGEFLFRRRADFGFDHMANVSEFLIEPASKILEVFDHARFLPRAFRRCAKISAIISTPILTRKEMQCRFPPAGNGSSIAGATA